MTKVKLNYNLLIYDIETAHLDAKIWRLGEQVVRHPQLKKSTPITKIITISYKWHNEKEIHTLCCDAIGSQKEMIKLFDKEIKKADVVLGKNNFNFDDKHINTARLVTGNDPMPEWTYKSEDLERQLRRYFTFPSQSLDYVGEILTGSGKVKMEERDWFDIENGLEVNQAEQFLNDYVTDEYCLFFYGNDRTEVLLKAQKAFDKMIKYNKKDILMTEQILNKVLPYITLKYNAATSKRATNAYACITCGSTNTESKNTVVRGTTTRHEFYCNDHKGYAGSRPFTKDANYRVRYTGPMGK